ncbi:MAG: hypothetical protein K8R85_02050 [Bacteroidetes bacterium]|nr:hypothetical protein [Bacteroidota bacterium]
MGIGTSYIPTSYKLAVEGKIIAEEFKIRLRANWPDYVFSSSYNLLPLEKLDDFLIKNNHLPGMPSANEVNANNGFYIGEIQVKQLEKTEELFLYVIELNKKIVALQKQNEELQKQIIEIKK